MPEPVPVVTVTAVKKRQLQRFVPSWFIRLFSRLAFFVLARGVLDRFQLVGVGLDRGITRNIGRGRVSLKDGGHSIPWGRGGDLYEFSPCLLRG